MCNELGNSWFLDDATNKTLEEFVCLLYGKKSNKINVVRYDKYKEVYEKKNKIQDLALLPPCQQSVQLHFKRSNYVARIWRSCLTAVVDFPNIGEHGWTNSGSIVWAEDILPENIVDILMNEDENDNESEVEDDSEGESEDD